MCSIWAITSTAGGPISTTPAVASSRACRSIPLSPWFTRTAWRPALASSPIVSAICRPARQGRATTPSGTRSARCACAPRAAKSCASSPMTSMLRPRRSPSSTNGAGTSSCSSAGSNTPSRSAISSVLPRMPCAFKSPSPSSSTCSCEGLTQRNAPSQASSPSHGSSPVTSCCAARSTICSNRHQRRSKICASGASICAKFKPDSRGLVPGIHVFLADMPTIKTWMAGHQGVHARLRRAMPGHDEWVTAMKVGLFGSAQAQRGGADLDSGAGFRDFIAYNVEAEALGYASSFVVEHHFTGFGQVSASLTLITGVAARTSTLRLGTAVLVLPWHNPVLLAEQAATIDLLSGGRLEFGVGKGYRANEFAGFCIPMEEAEERFEEGLRVILKAWTSNERFSHHGKYWNFENIVVEVHAFRMTRS